MKFYLSIILLLVLMTPVKGQFGYQKPFAKAPMNPYFTVDVEMLSNDIHNEFSEEIRNSYPLEVKEMSDYSALYTADYLAGPNVYRGWMQLTVYCRQIVKNLLGEDALPKNLRVIINRSPDFNASFSAGNILSINVGVFTYVNTEAELAFLIAHEISHSLQGHIIRDLEKGIVEKSYYNYGFLGSKYDKRMAFSRQAEIEADSFAFELLKQAGYNVHAGLKTLQILDLLSRNQVRKHPFLRYYKNGSHPTGEERKGYYQSLLNDSENGKSNFLIDSITFQNYKRIATVESIENALMQGALVQALETSFRAHLNKPSSPLFYYYIMESLRRDAVLNGASWNRDFLTYLYFEKGDKTQLSEGNKDSYNKGIFEVYDEEVIGISEDEFAKIEGNFYFKSGTYFRTNEQAFDFFFKMSQFYNCDECILSNAMSLYDSDKQQSLELINKYLQTPDPKRKMLAEALLNGDLNEGFPNKTLVVFPQQELKLIRGNNTINFYAPSFVQTTLDSVSKSFGNNFENRDVLLMKDQLEDQTTQSLLEWMHYLARYVKMSGDRNINLVFLNPDFYDLMKNLGYSSFEFVDLAFYQHVSNGNLKNVDDYASIKTALSSSLLSDEFAQFANIYISEIKDQLLLVDYARVDYQREEYSLNNEDSKLIAYKTLLTEAMLQKSNQKPRDTPYLIRKIAK